MVENIPERTRSMLIDQLTALLPTLPIVAKCFLPQSGERQLRSLDEGGSKNALPAAFRQKLKDMIDDHPIAEFCADRVQDLVWRNSLGSIEDVNPLMALVPATDFNMLAREIVAALAALPLTYTIVCALPRPLQALLPPAHSHFQVADGVSLERVSSAFWERFPVTEPPGLGQLGGLGALGADRKMYLGELAVVMEIKGLISSRRPTRTWVDAVLRFKAFLGLCIARGVVARSYSPDGPQPIMLHAYGAMQQLVVSRSLEPDSDRFLREIKLGYEPQSKITEALVAIGRVLSGQQRFQRIVLASRWLFDCSASGDELMAYIQGVTVLETLVGEPEAAKKGDVSITEVLRSRCAYMLGQSTGERDHLRALIGKIYDVRSRIVHDGQHHLSGPQRELLGQLRLLCGRVLNHEAQVAIAGE